MLGQTPTSLTEPHSNHDVEKGRGTPQSHETLAGSQTTLAGPDLGQLHPAKWVQGHIMVQAKHDTGPSMHVTQTLYVEHGATLILEVEDLVITLLTNPLNSLTKLGTTPHVALTVGSHFRWMAV
jgi:hypothetical protein